MSAKVTINPVSQILRDHGLNPGGHVQRFHTSNVLRRIKRYMPYRGGMLIKKNRSSDRHCKTVDRNPWTRGLDAISRKGDG